MHSTTYTRSYAYGRTSLDLGVTFLMINFSAWPARGKRISASSRTHLDPIHKSIFYILQPLILDRLESQNILTVFTMQILRNMYSSFALEKLCHFENLLSVTTGTAIVLKQIDCRKL